MKTIRNQKKTGDITAIITRIKIIKMANKKLEYKLLQKPAEDFLKYNKIKYVHLIKNITRVKNGIFYNFPIPGDKGFPDLLIVLNPIFFVELKIKGEKVTKEQIEYKKILEDLGYVYYVIREMKHFIALMQKKIKKKGEKNDNR